MTNLTSHIALVHLAKSPRWTSALRRAAELALALLVLAALTGAWLELFTFVDFAPPRPS